jgi:hypothetical protein
VDADGASNSAFLFDNGADSVAQKLLPEAGNPQPFSVLAQMSALAVTLAPSGVGFPLHSHGRSWIGLVRIVCMISVTLQYALDIVQLSRTCTHTFTSANPLPAQVRGVKLWAFIGPESLPATTEAEAMAVLPPLRWLREYGGSISAGQSGGGSLMWCEQLVRHTMVSRLRRNVTQSCRAQLLRASRHCSAGIQSSEYCSVCCTCLQPGDLLFVPDLWHHWTMNLGEVRCNPTVSYILP